jgi:hypothetical protein
MRVRMGGMRFRKLRIAWSVLCGLSCVPVSVLWLRSYWQRAEMYWAVVFFASLSALFACIPWLPWSNRFSLRTLLLATTLVAVTLGVIAYVASVRRMY